VVQADPFAEMDARIAAARSEAEAAQRNAESLQRALDQARETAYAAERRANELTRLRRGYATNSYR
jgi:multidrug resistance efflux pump